MTSTSLIGSIKMLEPDKPVLIIQNNYSRLQETALGADIIGIDSYPIPNVPLLLTPKAAQQPTLQPANAALHFLVKEAHGKLYLLVASDSAERKK